MMAKKIKENSCNFRKQLSILSKHWEYVENILLSNNMFVFCNLISKVAAVVVSSNHQAAASQQVERNHHNAITSSVSPIYKRYFEFGNNQI